jgi:rRNA maturation protein Nop10
MGNNYTVPLPKPTECVQFLYTDPNVDMVALETCTACTVSQNAAPVRFSIPDIRQWWDVLDVDRRGFITFREFLLGVRNHATINTVFSHLLYRIMPKTQKAAMAMHWAAVDNDKDAVNLPFVPSRTSLVPQDGYRGWFTAEKNKPAQQAESDGEGVDPASIDNDDTSAFPPHQKRMGKPSVAKRHSEQTQRLLRLCSIDVGDAWMMLEGMMDDADAYTMRETSVGAGSQTRHIEPNRGRSASHSQFSTYFVSNEVLKERKIRIELSAVIQQYSRLLDQLEMEFDGILQWAEFVKFFRKFGIVSDALTMEAKWHLLTVKARNLRDKAFRADSFRYFHQENSPGGPTENEPTYLRRVICCEPKSRPPSTWGEAPDPESEAAKAADGVAYGIHRGYTAQRRPARPDDVQPSSAVSSPIFAINIKSPTSTSQTDAKVSRAPSDDKLGIKQDETEPGKWLSIEDPHQPSRSSRRTSRRGLILHDVDEEGRPSTATTRPPTGSTERPSSAGSLDIARSRLWWRNTSRPNFGRIHQTAKHAFTPQRPTSAQPPSARQRPLSGKRAGRPASAGTRRGAPTD